jgi:hypothetical protein
MRAFWERALLATALLAAVGCHDAVTEIVLVIDTDLSVPSEVDLLVLELDTPAGVVRSRYELGGASAAATKFPATVGLVPGDAGGYGPFGITASLLHTTPDGAGIIVVHRTVAGLRFVRGSTRVLFLSLLRACDCQGTTCPNALDPACSDLDNPTLTPFDPVHLPRVTKTDGGATPTPDAGAEVSLPPDGAGAEAPPDLAVDLRPEVAPDAAADVTSADVRDAPPEAAPAKLARGHVCAGGDQCLEGFCIDGVCCESACTCGTCGGATPGRCAPAVAGTDPHDDCGSFVCDGAGKCVTTCPEGFGACSTVCKVGSHCDGAGTCMPSTTDVGLHCIGGSCMCKPGLTCVVPDAGGAGTCT